METLLYGILDLSFWGYVVVLLAFTQLTIFAVTIFLHRSQAHRGVDLHPVLSHIFRFWLWMTTGMVTKEWVAIHRKHHAKCETEEDPHSPQILGLKTVMWRGAELYRKESHNIETVERYGHNTPDDWLERNVYSRHSALGITIMFFVNAILFGLPGVSIWALQMAWIPFWAAGVVNGLGHYVGYRNFECTDASTNLTPWGFIIGGEELHNNHHTYPSSCKFSIKKWEFDIGWAFINVASKLGLAKVKYVAPKEEVVPGKTTADLDTVKAIISNRIQVMTHYGNQVIARVFTEEQRNNNGLKVLNSKVKHALLQTQNRLDDKAKQYIAEALASSKHLELVVQFRERLQGIWTKTTATQKELLEALQEWCKQAEASGVESLREFAAYLSAYRLRMTAKQY